jgi:hypothetical protein
MAARPSTIRTIGLVVLGLAAIGALFAGFGTIGVKHEVTALRMEVKQARAERARLRESIDSLTVAVAGLHQTVRAIASPGAAPKAAPTPCTTLDDCKLDETCHRGRCRALAQ